MCIAIALSGALLFLILTPGVLLRIPQKGSVLTVAVVHAIVFGILLYFISKAVYQSYNKVEKFKLETQALKSLNSKITKMDKEGKQIGNLVKLLLQIQNSTTKCENKIMLSNDIKTDALIALTAMNLENLKSCINL